VCVCVVAIALTHSLKVVRKRITTSVIAVVVAQHCTAL
jgi:hypothetical protein